MINCLYWNVKGIGNSLTRIRLKDIIAKHQVKVVVISEPMIDVSKLPSLYSFLNMLGYTSNCGSNGKVWLLWKQGVNITMISHDSQACNTSISKGVDTIFASTLCILSAQ